MSLQSRIRFVKTVQHCREVVERITELGKPIAVDLEGIHLKNISLVQIKADNADQEVFLFRTGIEDKLFHEGGLGKLFTNKKILKVTHGAQSGDLGALWRTLGANHGACLTPFYDTALAKAVIDFQNVGRPLISSTPSILRLCGDLDIPFNPTKLEDKARTWKLDQTIAFADPLPEKLALYAAWDVEPLFDLYAKVPPLLSEDFLIDLELLKALEEARAEIGKDRSISEYRREIVGTAKRTIFVNGDDREKVYEHAQKLCKCRVKRGTNSLHLIVIGSELEAKMSMIALKKAVKADPTISLDKDSLEIRMISEYSDKNKVNHSLDERIRSGLQRINIKSVKAIKS